MDAETKERLMTPGPPVEAPKVAPNLQLSALTRREENEVRDLRRQHAHARCADAMRYFSECSANYTIGVVWKCREHRDIMNECLRRVNTVEEMDRARSIIVDRRQKSIEEKLSQPRKLF
ncbi:hypothetical protein GGH91_003407 [Coemansia sp. RSA 2671]|uniref:COX assembly mitochondrial protein n=1 Tax=Coemansia spiralis TaxID=417178 RepID=A0A9W8GKB8_9FUNG|nr:hypothetical protein GGI06_004253 [Coemansia sp. S85]KAJ2342792.1 hypothetical protein GGH91_003407 [Coemansia sp. RSA 2671]KAJ2402644.1 hypothetical protein GGI10_005861 [Coemansia sp. RSA 2530]KAJ2687484.1 hypothetical protein IWW39_002898 [Coemansia spiralis]KAJ2697591.1 hypothetical protein H4218_003856 [Coemansia sp. IMI 209128]